MTGPQPVAARCPHLRILTSDPAAARIGGLGAAALRYADEIGLPVFKLKPGTKRPATEHGFLDATTDLAVIERWWREDPRFNVGIPTGQPSGLVVPDLDRKNGADGAAEFARWLAERGLQLPPAVPWAETPNYGVHPFVRVKGRTVQSRAGVLPGVDIRGDGGYVAVWPSGIRIRMLRRPGDPRDTRPMFGTYAWHGCPCQAPLAPPELLDALDGLHGSGTGGTGGTSADSLPELPPTEVLLERGIEHGGHDVNLSRLAARLCAQGKAETEAYAIWRAVADKTEDPADPFTAQDWRRHWKGAQAKGFGNPPGLSADQIEWAKDTTMSKPVQDAQTPWQQHLTLAFQKRCELHQHNRAWLHDADVNQLDFTLCVAITGGSTEDGEKLWGIIVGGSSSAKSEDIRMVFGVADARLSDLTAAGLISWMGADRKNAKVTGLLTRIPSPAFVVIEDLAPLLADTADRQNRSKLISILRRVYDGEVQRDLGGTPGQAAWSGKVTMLAASTKVIDRHSALLDEAGPRWLLYRGTESSAAMRLAGTGRRIDATERARCRKLAASLAAEVIGHGRAVFAHAELSEAAARGIGAIAVATGTMRGDVPRDGYGKREIIGIATTEEPWRLEAQLQLLARAAMSFGHTEDSAVRLARSVALGTVPPDRMRVMEVLLDGQPHNPSAIGRDKSMHRLVARRALEDLQQLGLARCTSEEHDPDVLLTAGVTSWWQLAGTDIARTSAQVILAR